MLSKQKLFLFSLIAILPVVILIPTEPILLIFIFMPITIFASAIIGLSFLKKSNLFTIGIASLVAISYPVIFYVDGYLRGWPGFN